jgi:hypothetical protein
MFILVSSFIQWIPDGFQESVIQDLHLGSLSLSLDGAELPQPQESYQQLHHLSLVTGFSTGLLLGKVFYLYKFVDFVDFDFWLYPSGVESVQARGA